MKHCIVLFHSSLWSQQTINHINQTIWNVRRGITSSFNLPMGVTRRYCPTLFRVQKWFITEHKLFNVLKMLGCMNSSPSCASQRRLGDIGKLQQFRKCIHPALLISARSSRCRRGLTTDVASWMIFAAAAPFAFLARSTNGSSLDSGASPIVL